MKRPKRPTGSLRNRRGVHAQHVQHSSGEDRELPILAIRPRKQIGSIVTRSKDDRVLIRAVHCKPLKLALQFRLYRVGFGNHLRRARPGSDLFDRRSEGGFVLRKRLKHQQPGIDRDDGVEDVGALIAFDQVDGSLASGFSLGGVFEVLESQGDQS